MSNKELSSWRSKHFKELEATLKVLRTIRDDPEASHKDRIEASKSIGRMLSAMSPSKSGDSKPEAKKNEHMPTEDERDEIERRLAN